MKESPKRNKNPLLSDEDHDEVNFATNLDDRKFEKSLEPSNVPPDSLEKAKEVYIDKNVTESQLPEMVTCYEESGFNVVKDICVDEGQSHGEIVKCDKEHHVIECNPINGDKHDDMIKDDLDTRLISTPLEDCYKNTCLISITEDDNVPSNPAPDDIKVFVEANTVDSSENFGLDNLMQIGEEKLDLSYNSPNTSINIIDPSKNSDDDDDDQQISETQIAGSEANEPRQINHTIDAPKEIKTEENTTSNYDNVNLTTASDPHELLLNTESEPDHHDMALNSITVAPRSGGESSFSMAGPVSGLITYSDPITASGSLSHRSDASNSSVRSFAFPILQNEWNSSPVRMAKVDPKQSRKHRGWRQALVCCRF